jgi:hypothetical protein
VKHLTLLSVLVLVAGCSETPIGLDNAATDALAASFAPAPKVGICHYSADTDTYSPLRINANAEAGHRSHGDAAEGEAVPGMPGYEFDAGCQPSQTADDLPVCLQAVVDAYNLASDPDWSFEGFGPWSVGWEDVTLLYLNGNGPYSVLVSDQGGGSLYCELTGNGAWVYTEQVADFQETREFLMALLP